VYNEHKNQPHSEVNGNEFLKSVSEEYVLSMFDNFMLKKRKYDEREGQPHRTVNRNDFFKSQFLSEELSMFDNFIPLSVLKSFSFIYRHIVTLKLKMQKWIIYFTRE